MIAETELKRRRVERRLPTPDRRAAYNLQGSAPHGLQRVDSGIARFGGPVLEVRPRAANARLVTYLEVLRDEICADCQTEGRPANACPLKYLLPSASQDVVTVEQRRRKLGEQLAWPDDEMPETD